MSNQQTVDIFKLIRDSPSAIAMQEPIDTIPSSASYRSARSWTVSLLIARPAQPQTMFLDHFSSIESLIGDRGILQDLSKTFEH
ncbi:unnamed protein product [Aureobasidium pullulans]|nr:unnamed protein product [Aureobasidium pullulans]